MLLPVAPESFDANVTFARSATCTVVFALEGADVMVFGDAIEPRPGQRPWEPAHYDVDRIKEVFFTTDEAAYTIVVEGAAVEADPRCAEFAHVEELFASISLLER